MFRIFVPFWRQLWPLWVKTNPAWQPPAPHWLLSLKRIFLSTVPAKCFRSPQSGFLIDCASQVFLHPWLVSLRHPLLTLPFEILTLFRLVSVQNLPDLSRLQICGRQPLSLTGKIRCMFGAKLAKCQDNYGILLSGN